MSGRPDLEHKAAAPPSVRCYIITVSDTRTEETDTGGRAIADLLTAAGQTSPDRDDRQGRCRAGARHHRAAARQAATCRSSSRPAAPASRRATARTKRSARCCEKRLDGFGELFRMLSYEQIGSAAMMSRACAGLAAAASSSRCRDRKRRCAWRWRGCSFPSSDISSSRPGNRFQDLRIKDLKGFEDLRI